MIYLTSVIAFGCIQIWTLWLTLKFNNILIDWKDLVKDGGLFIFATSLAVTTHIQHRKISNRISDAEKYWSSFWAFIIVIVCILGFSTAIKPNERANTFEITLTTFQNTVQLGVAIAAVLYGFIVEQRMKEAVK